MLSHVLILNERQLEGMLKEYAFAYVNKARPHQGIEQRIPAPSERKSYATGAHVVALPVLGGATSRLPGGGVRELMRGNT